MDNKKLEVLVVEDSRPDRLKIRMLLEEMGINFSFAWNAKTKKVLSVKKILNILNDENPHILVVDMAWSTSDEIALQRLLFLDYEEINKKMQKPNKMVSISGFKLIRKIVKNNDPNRFSNLQKVIILTQHIPPVSYGIRKYVKYLFGKNLNIKAFFIHKWRDEDRFRRQIRG